MVNIPYKIVVTTKIIKELEKKGLMKQFLKTKNKLLAGNIDAVNFKMRQPKGSGLWYRRVNKQYRIVGEIRSNIFFVTYLDDHQN